jgi:hypothetical protein
MDNGVANDGISRALNGTDGSHTDFKNPTTSLTVKDTNAVGGSVYEFQTLDTKNRPAIINLDTGATNGDLQQIDGSYTNVVEDLPNAQVHLDGLTIGIPGTGFNNAFLNTTEANLTIEPQPGNHRTLMDNGVANDRISRAFNATDGSHTDFKNPAFSLTVLDTTGGGDTFEFQGLDAVGRPGRIVLDSGGNDDTLQFDGTVTSATVDAAARTVNLDGLVVAFPNIGGHLVMNVHSTNFTFNTAVGANELISDAGNGFTRALNLNTGLYTDFLNPTGLLTFNGTASHETFTFQGLSPVGAPPTVRINGKGGNDQFNITPSAAFAISVTGGATASQRSGVLTVVPADALGAMILVTPSGTGLVTFTNKQAIFFVGMTSVNSQ